MPHPNPRYIPPVAESAPEPDSCEAWILAHRRWVEYPDWRQIAAHHLLTAEKKL